MLQAARGQHPASIELRRFQDRCGESWRFGLCTRCCSPLDDGRGRTCVQRFQVPCSTLELHHQYDAGNLTRFFRRAMRPVLSGWVSECSTVLPPGSVRSIHPTMLHAARGQHPASIELRRLKTTPGVEPGSTSASPYTAALRLGATGQCQRGCSARADVSSCPL